MKRRPSLVSASNHGLTKNFSSAAKTFIAIQDAGRRTFICFALSSGFPPQVVMKCTSHFVLVAARLLIQLQTTMTFLVGDCHCKEVTF